METILKDILTQRDLSFYVNQYNREAFVYPTLFPEREVLGTTFKALALSGGPRVAADVIARNTDDIVAKDRPAIEPVVGELAKIAVVRQMDELILEQYRLLQGAAQGAQGIEAVKLWADDVTFAIDAANARIEWLALRSISAGKIKLTAQNNIGAVSGVDVEYSVKAKGGVTTPWSTTATADPFANLKAAVATARQSGIYLKYAFMNSNTLASLAQCEKVQKLCAGILAGLANIQSTPSLEQINAALKTQSDFFGLQIVEVNQNIAIENAKGDRVSANPFVDGVVMLSEDMILGNTYWSKPIEATQVEPGVMTANNGCVFIKKFAESRKVSPIEFTVGIANAFPFWASAGRSYLIDTTHSTWQPTL